MPLIETREEKKGSLIKQPGLPQTIDLCLDENRKTSQLKATAQRKLHTSVGGNARKEITGREDKVQTLLD